VIAASPPAVDPTGRQVASRTASWPQALEVLGFRPRVWLGRSSSPGQELIEPVDLMIVGAGGHVGEPGLGVDVVEPSLRRSA
jgi:hypothetical protein